jgi:hypothetical protein
MEEFIRLPAIVNQVRAYTIDSAAQPINHVMKRPVAVWIKVIDARLLERRWVPVA